MAKLETQPLPRLISRAGHRARRSLSAGLGPLTLLVTGAAMLSWTWRAWPDPLVDFGRELYVPWRLAEGETLFRDIAWFNGPLSQNLNALWFRMFGPGLSVLVWSNVLVLAATLGMLYGLIARMSDRLTAAAAGMVFLLVFAFGQYVGIGNYNWITPYSHELTHGIALALAALVALERWDRQGSVLPLALGGLALGFCFLTKVETFLAGMAGSLVLLAPALRRREGRALGIFGGAAMAPIVASVLLVGLQGTLGAWPSVLAGKVAELPFYLAGMGMDQPGVRIKELLAWSGIWLLASTPPLALSWFARGTRSPVAPLAAGASVLVILALLGDRTAWGEAMRPLPLFLVAAMGGLGIAWWRGARRSGHMLALALAAFSLVLLAKMLLQARVAHYGFALAMPASLLLVTALVGWLPAWLEARGLRGDVFRACSLALLAVFALEHVAATGTWLDRKTELVGTGRDAFRSDIRGAFVNRAVSYVAASGATSVAVLPEGAMINYLARTANPTRFVNFMPPEEILFGDEAWTEAFRSSPADVIVFVPRDLSEYGRGLFGIGFGRSLANWVASEYVLGSVIRLEEVPFEVRILVRR